MRSRITVVVFAAVLLLLFAGLSLAQNPVTFQVNMKVQMQQGNFNPATDTLVVRGSFNGWAGVADSLTDADGDSLYIGVVDMPDNLVGTTIEYKFVILAPNAGDNWESVPNRTFVLQSGGQVLDVVFFNDDIGPVDAEVFFFCDMSVQILGGFFDPNVDPMSVRGAFNGWGQTPMSPDIFTPTIYTANVEMPGAPGGSAQPYKYFYSHDGSDVWEEPLSTNGGNRTFVVTGTEPDNDNDGFVDVVLDTVYFGDISPDVIFDVDTDVFFEVDMRPAYAYLAIFDSLYSAAPAGWEKSIDSVFIAGSTAGTEPPMYWVWDVLNEPNKFKPLKMNDEGTNGDLVAGDSVFTIKMVFKAGAPRSATYKYGINAHDNEAGFAKNHIENVYEPPNFRHYDQFGEQDTLYTSVWNYQDTTVVSIGDEFSFTIPEAYDVFQNYPNPFNPSTTIAYALTKPAQVKLVIYNVLGQKVRTLLDKKVNAGVHNVVWDGINDAGVRMGSGIYFYHFQAGNFSKTMKMVLMK